MKLDYPGATKNHTFRDLVIYVDFMLILAHFWLPFGVLWLTSGSLWLPFGSLLMSHDVFIQKIDARTSKMVSKCRDRVMEGGRKQSRVRSPIRSAGLPRSPQKDALQIY